MSRLDRIQLGIRIVSFGLPALVISLICFLTIAGENEYLSVKEIEILNKEFNDFTPNPCMVEVLGRDPLTGDLKEMFLNSAAIEYTRRDDAYVFYQNDSLKISGKFKLAYELWSKQLIEDCGFQETGENTVINPDRITDCQCYNANIITEIRIRSFAISYDKCCQTGVKIKCPCLSGK